MSNTILGNAFKAVADAIRAKGVTGTMSPLEMPAKVASIPSGSSTKYGVAIDEMIGDLNSSGVLQPPSQAFSFNTSEIITLSDYSLYYRFVANTALTSVSLPNLALVNEFALYGAFHKCSALTTVDLSNVKRIANNGAISFCSGCTSLRTVYLSSLSSLGIGGLNFAFSRCTSLELVDFSKATAVPALSNTNAFANTNNYYRIVVPNALYNQWINATNWSDPSIVTHIEKATKGLVFAANAANSTISLDAVGTPPSLDLEYSTDDGVTFSTYTVGTTITLANVGDEVLFRSGSGGNTTIASDLSNYYKFVMSGTIACEGNIHYLLNQTGTEPQGGLSSACFSSLFYGCTSLTTAPTLPATILANNCYQSMFQGCTSLTTAPTLPATILAEKCYQSMFRGCTSLTAAPELPATTLADNCYQNMFQDCTSLTTAPELPATTLANNCYQNMFRGCTSLTAAPELPATTLANNCYYSMFRGCSSLNTIKLSYTGNFSSTYFPSWVNGVQTTSGTFYYNGSDTTRGNSAIPVGWTITPFST